MTIKYRIFVLTALVSGYCMPDFLIGQDSIDVEDLRQYSYSFDIEDGVLTGKGAEILTKAISNAHITMLGNNTRNQQESDLDLALSFELNKSGYKTMVMEIGPASGRIVNRLSQNSTNTIETFKKLNIDYCFETDELSFMPIPDLKHVGTAQMVGSVKENDWSIAGIGVDSWTGYKFLIDELYNNLPYAHQQLLLKEYKMSTQLLDNLYANLNGQSNNDLLTLTTGVRESQDFQYFLKEANSFEINQKIVESFQFSIDYWWLFGNREFYKKNMLSSKRNKGLIKEELERIDFDFKKDKLFLKMWRGHLVNGVTPNGFYGVGNMLMELAAYHGHNSLNIGVVGRYTMVGEEIVDAMDNPENIPSPHRLFVSLGKTDDWVLIDLRPFNKEFYWGNYIQTLDFHKMMRNYDMILIPKTDSQAITNK